MTDQNRENSPVSTTESTSCNGFELIQRRFLQWFSAIRPISPSRNLDTTATGYECSICLQENSREEKYSLRCSHQFHSGCIFAWISEKGSCPVCREESAVEYKLPCADFEEFHNPGIDMRHHNGCIDASLGTNCFLRLCDVNIEERMFKEGGIDIKHADGSFIKINNISDYSEKEGSLTINDGTITMMLMNVRVMLDRDGSRMTLDNGGFLQMNGVKYTRNEHE